jgi:class 3 adenylate cyclase
MAFKQISLKSKLVIMLLSISLCSILIVGYQGLRNGKEALTTRLYDQLTSVRESKRSQIQALFSDLNGQVKSLAIDHIIIRAMGDFNSAYKRLDKKTLDNDQMKTLKAYYQDEFIPRLEKSIHGKPPLENYFPSSPAAQYLQYHYIANNDANIGKKNQLDDANDKSYYSAVHAYNHPVLNEIIKNFGYYDLFLIDLETGNIVYSVYKETDFSTSLEQDAYRSSNLGKLYKKIKSTQDYGNVQQVGYDFYRASYGVPASFFGSTIFDENKKPIGIVAIQLSNEKFSNIMTGNKGWKKQGLGDTGESYIVGADYLMRTDARLLSSTEKFKQGHCYATQAIGNLLIGGDNAQKICDLNTSILLQKVDSPIISKALSGQTGTAEIKSYSGKKALAAYAPLQVGNIKLAIVSQIDLAEANQPIVIFQKELGISAVIQASIITFLAMTLAYLFTKPFGVLMSGARKLSKGEADIHIQLDSNDEFGELAKVMNSTGQLIQEQQQQIIKKTHENKILLLNIVPEKIAKQLEHGKTQIAEKISNVSIVYTTLKGFSENIDHMTSEQAINLINRLIDSFDAVAEKYNIEKVKMVGDSYLGASGLNISRLDHANRCVQFGLELLSSISSFNQRHQTNFSLRIGVHSGSVLAGVVGKRNFAYDLWGETVNIAGRIRFEAPPNSLIISDNVYSRLNDRSVFQQKKTFETHTMRQLEIWTYTRSTPPKLNINKPSSQTQLA